MAALASQVDRAQPLLLRTDVALPGQVVAAPAAVILLVGSVPKIEYGSKFFRQGLPPLLEKTNAVLAAGCEPLVWVWLVPAPFVEPEEGADRDRMATGTNVTWPPWPPPVLPWRGIAQIRRSLWRPIA
jgi:hypothetical protein